MPPVTLARHAMATRFEIVLHGDDPVALRAAGEEALGEIDRLEAQLSLYRNTSEVSRLNARAARQPVKVTPELFALLLHAKKLHQESGGAFDITIGPLVRCWGFMDGGGHRPNPEELALARAMVGMDLVRLEPEDSTVQFAREGVMLDLGAIGKGYAIERAADLLREAGITSALLHGGTSTVYAIGQPPGAEAWKVAIENPHAQKPGAPPAILAAVPLRDEALSVSAVWGKSFQEGGKTFGHVINPQNGEPANAALLAAVILPSATETDALSTALLTLGRDGHQTIAKLRPGMRTLLLTEANGEIRIETNGIAALPTPGY
ncbi:MAG: FAD:protein transferase [Verrucomicrobiota bacterium]